MEALTRQVIYGAVINLLMRDGIQGLTMDRVAAEAGVAKGTLYVYFENKEQLLKEAVDATFDPLINSLIVLLDGDFLPDRKLAEFSLCNLQFFDERKDLIRVLFYDREMLNSDKTHYTDSRYRNILQRLANVLDKGVEEGLFVPLDSMKVAAMFLEANMGVVMQRIQDNVSGDIERDARQVTDIFMSGLRGRD